MQLNTKTNTIKLTKTEISHLQRALDVVTSLVRYDAEGVSESTRDELEMLITNADAGGPIPIKTAKA